MSNILHTRRIAMQRSVILGLLITATFVILAPVHAQIAPSALGQRNEHDEGTNNSKHDNNPAPGVDWLDR